MLNVIGERIQKRRIEMNLTQQQLAKELHRNRETINQWENHSRDLKSEDIKSLAVFFNVSTDYLLGLTTDPTSNVTMRDISKITGLTENTINELKKINCLNNSLSENFVFNFIDKFLGDSTSIFIHIYHYLSNIADIFYLTDNFNENDSIEKKYILKELIDKSNQELNVALLNITNSVKDNIKKIGNTYLSERLSTHNKKVSDISHLIEDIDKNINKTYSIEEISKINILKSFMNHSIIISKFKQIKTAYDTKCWQNGTTPISDAEFLLNLDFDFSELLNIELNSSSLSEIINSLKGGEK